MKGVYERAENIRLLLYINSLLHNLPGHCFSAFAGAWILGRIGRE